MIVGIDFDGVLAATDDGKRAWVFREFGLDLKFLSVTRTALEPVIGADAYSRMQLEVGYRDTLSALPLCNSIEVISELSSIMDFHVITARSPEKVVWVDRWVEQNGLSSMLKGVHSSAGGTKGAIAGRIGARWLVDNDVRHLEALPLDVNAVHFECSFMEPSVRYTVKCWVDLHRILCGQMVETVSQWQRF